MAICRTEWSKMAMKTMIDKELDIKDIAKAIQRTPQYVSSVMYGRLISPNAQKQIADYLGIPDA